MSNGTQEFSRDSLLCLHHFGLCLVNTFLFVWQTYAGEENKKGNRAINTALILLKVTLCHTLLIPVSCSLSNHRLFLKLACSYLLSFLSYSYPFSNCSSYFLLPMVLFCFVFICFFLFFYCFLVFSSCTRGHFVLDDLCPCEVLVPLFYHWLH